MIPYLCREAIRKLPGAVIQLVPKPEPRITEGVGSRVMAGELLRNAGCRSCLLVTDTTLRSLGYHERVADSLQSAGIRCRVFSGIASEPTMEIIENGRKAALDASADCILALGGGSVLDSCKMIAAGARYRKRRIPSLLTKFLFVRGGTLPILAIPTTAGTGAETTVGAVVTRKSGKKGSTVLIGLNVTDVILDSELTMHAPRLVTAACGIDALSHGLEGAVADVKVSPEDERKSMECVRLVLENLGGLLTEPENDAARLNMARAAFYGGNAINKQLAGWVHAAAHTLGAEYHIPHGEAIALTLLPVMRFQQEKCAEKLQALAAYCGLADGDALLSAVEELIKKCEFPKRGALIPPKDYGRIAAAIAADSINYSAPVTMKKQEIFRLLDEMNGKG